MQMSEERITVTERNKLKLEKDYTEGKISAIIYPKGSFANVPIGFDDQFRKRTPHFDFNIGDIVVINK